MSDFITVAELRIEAERLCDENERMQAENDKLRELERGTCHVLTIGEFNGEATEYYDICSNCCYEFDDDPLNYCPNCGARIEVDE